MQRGNGGYDMKRVLIADDEPIDRMIVTRTIQKYFPEELAVVSAVNGREAVGLVNTGRLGAQGLYNVCASVSKANAQPGDLIFFVGTYDTPGVSHVGIYVGDGVMIHCGDPIQYTSINSSFQPSQCRRGLSDTWDSCKTPFF